MLTYEQRLIHEELKRTSHEHQKLEQQAEEQFLALWKQNKGISVFSFDDRFDNEQAKETYLRQRILSYQKETKEFGEPIIWTTSNSPDSYRPYRVYCFFATPTGKTHSGWQKLYFKHKQKIDSLIQRVLDN